MYYISCTVYLYSYTEHTYCLLSHIYFANISLIHKPCYLSNLVLFDHYKYFGKFFNIWQYTCICVKGNSLLQCRPPYHALWYVTSECMFSGFRRGGETAMGFRQITHVYHSHIVKILVQTSAVRNKHSNAARVHSLQNTTFHRIIPKTSGTFRRGTVPAESRSTTISGASHGTYSSTPTHGTYSSTPNVTPARLSTIENPSASIVQYFA